MAAPDEPRREHPSTYFVQDRSNEEEMNRLHVQDKMVTDSMDGVLPEQPDPERFRRVLDIGSGSGSWVLEPLKPIQACPYLGLILASVWSSMDDSKQPHKVYLIASNSV